ncbi:hypothetical protein EON77_05235 [bacterium]|nr:MAG: hypothetical protein EON77_05235 [bacterium]
MKHFLSSFAVLLLTSLAACSSEGEPHTDEAADEAADAGPPVDRSIAPRVEEAVEIVAPAMCERAEVCVGTTTFLSFYPGGIKECVDAAVKRLPPEAIGNPSLCTKNMLKTCTERLQRYACDKMLEGSVPAECKKC